MSGISPEGLAEIEAKWHEWAVMCGDMEYMGTWRSLLDPFSMDWQDRSMGNKVWRVQRMNAVTARPQLGNPWQEIWNVWREYEEKTWFSFLLAGILILEASFDPSDYKTPISSDTAEAMRKRFASMNNETLIDRSMEGMMHLGADTATMWRSAFDPLSHEFNSYNPVATRKTMRNFVAKGGMLLDWFAAYYYSNVEKRPDTKENLPYLVWNLAMLDN